MISPRSAEKIIRTDREEKMVFISGPRQVEKTTLAKTLLENKEDCYFSWDNRGDRKKILAARWPAVRSTVVFDELHK